MKLLPFENLPLHTPRRFVPAQIDPGAWRQIEPLYYVEYGIAQVGALQLWANSKVDRAKALRDYQSALALGGSRPLPELFSTAGCRFDFTAATVKPLVNLLRGELAALD